jgi:hypothetical protein
MLPTIRSFMDAHKLSDVTSWPWRRDHPDEPVQAGTIATQPGPAGPGDQRRDQVMYCQYRTIAIRVDDHTLTAADPLPDDLRHVLIAIHERPTAY